MTKITVEKWSKQWAIDFNHDIPLALNNICAHCARIAHNYAKDNFRLQGFNGDNGIEKWAPRKKKYAWSILNHTGQLKKSLQEETHKGKGRSVARVYTDSKAFLGFNYAAFHNQPSGTYSRPYPSIQRQFIGYSREIEDDLFTVFKNFFINTLPGGRNDPFYI